MHSLQVRIAIGFAASAAALGVPALAGETGAEDLPITFVTDVSTGQVYRLRDLDLDGSYNGSGETAVFYDPLIGATPLALPNCLSTAADDYLYIGDPTNDRILAMEDLDNDGTCHDSGEHGVYFDGTAGGNPSGILMTSPNGVVTVLLGIVWVANADSGAGDLDAIIRLQDLNTDLDANDPGESSLYYVPPGSSTGDSVPTAVEIGEDGYVYYVENSTTGAIQKGIYRLEDANMNNTIDGPAEVVAFFLPPPQALPMDLIALDVVREESKGEGKGKGKGKHHAEEVWYLLDLANDLVWRLEDLNENGLIDLTNPGEAVQWWQSGVPASSSPRDLSVTEGQQVLITEPTDPDRVQRLYDGDSSGVVDPFEESDPYLDLVNPDVDMVVPWAIDNDFHGHAEVGVPFCAGTAFNCPCANPGEGGSQGCANSTGIGAAIEGFGTVSVALDDLEISIETGPPNSFGVLVAGQVLLNGGDGVVGTVVPFDGLRCVGQFIRMGTRALDANGEASWGPGLSALGGWQAGSTRFFQVFYRDTFGPCSTGVNTTGALQVTFNQ